MYFSNAPFKVSLLAAAIALTGCGGDSSSSSDGADEPRDGGEVGTPVSGFTISAMGGSADLGDGGAGGDVDIRKYNSSTALSILKEGEVSTAYTLPAQEISLGANPVTLTQDVTVFLVEDRSEPLPPVGTLYMLDSSEIEDSENGRPGKVTRLYVSNGSDAYGTVASEVTGINVPAGMKLILPENNGTKVELFFRNDVQNDGEIYTEKREASSRSDLEIHAAAYYGSGSIPQQGDDEFTDGQDGGDVSIFARTIRNSGAITTAGAEYSGGEGSSGGGTGGEILLHGQVFVENTGVLNSSGGTYGNGSPGQAGDVRLQALDLYNSGDIVGNTGKSAGALYNSNSTDIELFADKTLINTGNISAVGSQAEGNGNNNAGKGGDILVAINPIETEEEYEDGFNSSSSISSDKKLVTTGNLIVDGGSTDRDDNTGRAGNGGTIYVGSIESFGGEGSAPSPNRGGVMPATGLSSSITVSGNLSANGGSTLEADEGANANAGDGGNITVWVIDQTTSNVESALLGYTSIDVSAGHGRNGSNAGSISVKSDDVRLMRGGSYVPGLSGPLLNEADLLANGGSSNADVVEVGEDEISGEGGSAGSIDLIVQNGFAHLQPGELTLSNSGAISLNGGRSFDDSDPDEAKGGSFTMSAPDALTLTADVTANGGSDDHEASISDRADHEGSDGGSILLRSQYGAITATGTLSVNGGNGDLVGGDAGSITMEAKAGINAQGIYELNGGNAQEGDGFSDTLAGDAGELSLMSYAYNSTLEATINAEAGTGSEEGQSKYVVVDADCQSAYCAVDQQEPIFND